MKKTPKISIIIPVYNVERYLPRCLDSVLAQTFADFELLLIDDGSPDRSPAICDQYAAKDPRIQVFHKPNGGVSSARNLGIDHAQGSFIAFIDADDYIEPNFLEEMLNAMNRYNADLVCCGVYEGEKNDGSYAYIRKTDKDKKFTRNEMLIEMLAPDSCGSAPFNKLYKASIIKSNQIRFPEDMKYWEDSCFVIKYTSHCAQTAYISNVLYHYVANDTSVTHKKLTTNTIDYRYIDRLKVNKLYRETMAPLQDRAVTSALNARLFVSNLGMANSIITQYDDKGDEKEYFFKLRENLMSYFRDYLKNPRYFKVLNKKAAIRLLLQVYLYKLYVFLYKIKHNKRQ